MLTIGSPCQNIPVKCVSLMFGVQNTERRWQEEVRTWGFRVLLRSRIFIFILFTVIFTSCQTSSRQTPSGLAGVRSESVLAIQVYIESRWLKLFLEWFMSAQTLRGQSKHKATLSNLLHPMLWHSCPNGSALLRMTMN